MDDIVPLAKLQRLTNVDAELDDIPPRHRVLVDIRQQRVQQLHADENVPADAVGVLQHAQVLAADDVRRALELEHDGKLVHKLLDDAVKICLGLRNAHTLGDHAPDLRAALRDRDHLQRRPVRLPELAALDFKYFSIAAFAKAADYVPIPQHLCAGAVCFALHGCSFPQKTMRRIAPPFWSDV